MTRRQRRNRSLFVVVAVSLALGTTLLIAGSASTSLSNGAQLSVSISSPLTGDEFEVPPGVPTINVPVTGSASVGLGEADATFIYVVDTSGSTSGGSGTGCAPVLTCEKQFFVALNAAVAADGSTDEVGLVNFGDGAAIHDMQLAAGFQNFTLPSDPNVNTVINSLGAGGLTNCTAALNRALDLVNASSNSVNNVVFASDGFCNEGGDLTASAQALAATGAIVNAIAIGTNSSCTVNIDPFATGTLDEIPANGGQCFHVLDPGDLPNLISNLTGSTLQSLSMEVNGGGSAPITNTSLPLPQPGAVSVNYTASADNLGPADHTICVTANGSDVLGGTASVTQCETIHLLQLSASPATETNDLTVSSSHTVTATIAGDPAQVAGRTVNFVVGGQNAGAVGSCSSPGCVTDAAGQVDFTYSVAVAPSSIGADAITVSTLIGGNNSTVTVAKIWADLTPPVAACNESFNPAENTPKASKTNEDGFFNGTAVDVVDPNATVTIVDLGTGTSFGPFASGVTFKYTQAPGVTPKIEAMSGAVAWHIWGKGDIQIIATDSSGNTSTANCFVPPLPK